MTKELIHQKHNFTINVSNRTSKHRKQKLTELKRKKRQIHNYCWRSQQVSQ